MAVTVSIAKAREQFSELINQAAYAGQRPILTRHGRPVAAIVSIGDLERLERGKSDYSEPGAAFAIDTDAIREICTRYRVRELSLFGSALRDDFGPDSDVDLLVDFLPDAKVGFIEMGRLEAEFESLFDRRVDLVPKRGLRPLLRDEVLSTSRVVYAT